MPKKKSSGKGDASGATTSINLVEVPKIVNPAMLCATLNIRMVTWKYLNFQVKVRLNSRIFSIEEKIRQHHGGSVHQVFLYQGVVAPENLLSDPSLTLYDAGFDGDIEGQEPEQDVWYDFQPLQTSCPLLMATPSDREQRESPYRSVSRTSNRSPSPSSKGPAATSTAKRGSVVDLSNSGGASPLVGSTPANLRRESVASFGSPTIAPLVRPLCAREIHCEVNAAYAVAPAYDRPERARFARASKSSFKSASDAIEILTMLAMMCGLAKPQDYFENVSAPLRPAALLSAAASDPGSGGESGADAGWTNVYLKT